MGRERRGRKEESKDSKGTKECDRKSYLKRKEGETAVVNVAHHIKESVD